MKYFRTFKLVIATCLFIFALNSCEKNDYKEAPLNDHETTSGFENIIGNYKTTPSSRNRTYFDNHKVPGVDGTDYGCKEPALNCQDDVDVLAEPDKTIIKGIFSTIETGDQDDIISTFTNNRSTLIQYVDSNAIDDVIDTILTVYSRGTSFKIAKYMIFKDEDLSVELAAPFTIK